MARNLPIILACGAVVVGHVAVAQQPGIELNLETQTLELGEAIDVQLVCTNTGRPQAPEAAVSEGLDLKLLNAEPFSSSFTQIVNGRRTDRVTHTYSMRLAALKVGTYTFGPVTVVADGRTYQTDPVRIVVRDSETASVPHGDRYLYVELEVEPRSLYVTESFTATLTIGMRKVVINGRTFDMDLLGRVLDTRASELSVFANGRARRSERWLTDADGERHRYEVFKVTQTVRAEDVGERGVGPVFLKANYPTAVRMGFFGRYDISRTRRETARAEGIVTKVKAPPEEGRPAGFTGTIGQFTMNVAAKPVRVEQGQPVTLTISIQGAPVEGVAGPDLTKQPELASRFDYTKDELVGDLEDGGKAFRRAIFPKQVGEQTIPAIKWSFFDPRREEYVTLGSEPISLTVDPPTSNPATITLLPEPKGSTLTVLTGGISPNFVDIDALLAYQAFSLTLPWMAALVVSPLVWLFVTLTTRHRARLRTDVRFARRRRARRLALIRINHALRNGEPTQQLRGLADALTEYLSDRFDHPAATLTSNEVRSLLALQDTDGSMAAEIVAFLESCDAVRYAAGATGRQPALKAAADVRAWIKRIERGSRCR